MFSNAKDLEVSSPSVQQTKLAPASKDIIEFKPGPQPNSITRFPATIPQLFSMYFESTKELSYTLAPNPIFVPPVSLFCILFQSDQNYSNILLLIKNHQSSIAEI